MAEKKDAKGKNTAPKKKGVKIVPFLILLAILPFFLPSLILMIGMAPTLAALFSDDDPEYSKTIAVGATNFAGIFPFLIELWQKGETKEVAIQIIKEPNTWLVMLGGAAVGHLILYIIPPLIMALTVGQSESRLTKLQDGLAQLKEIWGPDVTTTVALDVVRKKNMGL